MCSVYTHHHHFIDGEAEQVTSLSKATLLMNGESGNQTQVILVFINGKSRSLTTQENIGNSFQLSFHLEFYHWETNFAQLYLLNYEVLRHFICLQNLMC